jgi:hypothetical protein
MVDGKTTNSVRTSKILSVPLRNFAAWRGVGDLFAQTEFCTMELEEVAMKKMLPVLLILVLTLACQALMPAPARDGTVISNCSDLVAAVRALQPQSPPQGLSETGVKSGGEFDVNEYFSVLPHLSLKKGYVLDYIYSVDFLGSFPMLYVRPEEQAPYASVMDLPQDAVLEDYHNYLVVEDVEQGYFEEAALTLMDRQFYLVWHANYNDTDIVCDKAAVNDIIAQIDEGEFGYELDSSQKVRARSIQGVEPLVKLTEDTAIVEMVIFTKWGGFFRQTYTISRSFPHRILDVQEENLVPYDCGIMF